MPSASPVPPVWEQELGLGFYASSTPGVAGRIKGSSEAFRVREISNHPRPDPHGPFTVLRVESRDWEQHELGAAIARRLGLASHAIQWSGTKDRRAVADRLLSYRGAPPPGPLGLPRVEVLEAYRARDGLVLGHHYGNAFEILVEETVAPPAEALGVYRATEAALRQAGGFPNFFGPQRFGEVRPVTHDVGRWVVRGDLTRAVDVYLTALPGGRVEGVGDEARRAYAEHRDPARALVEFPREYRFERLMLDHLARGHGAERAFRALGRDLRLLFVHAYQALLFNRWLLRRHLADLPFDRPVPGDRILRVGRDGTVRSQEAAPVGADNERECAELVGRGRAFVAGPLIGFETPRASGPAGELLQGLLEDEGLDPKAFRLPVAPEVASRGAWRPALVGVPPLGLAESGSGVWFRFALPKGTYATVLLREFLKRGATPSDDRASSRAY